MKAPDKQTVVLETVAAIAAYGPGLAWVTVISRTASDAIAFVSGVAVTLFAFGVLYFVLLGRSPSLLGRRPWRYSWPNVIGLMAGFVVSSRGLDAPTTFALAIPLVTAGQAVSQLLWSASSRRAVVTGSA